MAKDKPVGYTIVYVKMMGCAMGNLRMYEDGTMEFVQADNELSKQLTKELRTLAVCNLVKAVNVIPEYLPVTQDTK